MREREIEPDIYLWDALRDRVESVDRLPIFFGIQSTKSIVRGTGSYECLPRTFIVKVEVALAFC